MASCAIRLLESPDLAESIAHNSYDECSAYTWPAVRSAWLTVYRQLVGIETSPSPSTGVVSPSHMMHSGTLEGAAEKS